LGHRHTQIESQVYPHVHPHIFQSGFISISCFSNISFFFFGFTCQCLWGESFVVFMAKIEIAKVELRQLDILFECKGQIPHNASANRDKQSGLAA